jgi:protein SCO1/2
VSWCLGVFVVAVAVAHAQNVKPPILQDIRIDQRLNEQLPLDVTFRDETGKSVQLGQYFGRRPVILSFAYYECPMLCTLVLNGLTKGMRVIPFDIGNQFVVVNISINPREGPDLAAAKKASYVRDYGRAGAENGWHFLTGDEAAIQRVAKAAGFRYVYDPTTGQYAHASGIMIVTPKGRLSRYFYGIEYPGQDLRLGLIEASEEKIGTLADQVLLYCFHYDPVTGRYGLAITVIMRVFGSATAIAIVAFMLVMLRRERRSAG